MLNNIHSWKTKTLLIYICLCLRQNFTKIFMLYLFQLVAARPTTPYIFTIYVNVRIQKWLRYWQAANIGCVRMFDSI